MEAARTSCVRRSPFPSVTGIDPDSDPFDPARVAGLALAGIAINNLVRAFLPLAPALEPAP